MRVGDLSQGAGPNETTPRRVRYLPADRSHFNHGKAGWAYPPGTYDSAIEDGAFWTFEPDDPDGLANFADAGDLVPDDAEEARRRGPIGEILREVGRGGSLKWLPVVFVAWLVAELTLFDASVGDTFANAVTAVLLFAGVMLAIATIRRRRGDGRADAIGALAAVGLLTLGLVFTLIA